MIRKFKFAAIFFSVVALIGCTTFNELTGEREANRTGTGAIAGAAAGAAIGGLVGEDVKSAIIGAGVGALAGAAVGAYMDRQERALREDLSDTGVGIKRVGDTIQLQMPSNITFDTGQAVVKPDFRPILDDVSSTLAEYESTVISIAGHTDSTGSTPFNQQLSENRAAGVRNYMVTRGIIPERVLTSGYGETVPIADNTTATGRQQNRRVEITLQPLTQ
jgi:outer membrane protein OmpA-like peptidoglycan-associated protein